MVIGVNTTLNHQVKKCSIAEHVYAKNAVTKRMPNAAVCVVWAVVGLVGLCGLFGLVSCDHKQQPNAAHQLQTSAEQPVFETVTLAGEQFTLQLAMDDDARFKGLSDVAEIPNDGGMMFVFPRSRELTFVMRKCLVPIDVIFFGPGGRIVAMHQMKMVPYDTPESKLVHYSSGWPAQIAIELRQGSIERLGLKIGQKIELPLARLKAEAS